MAGYPADLTLKAKLLSTNTRGVLSIASAPEMQLATASRAMKPLPPGNVKLNAQPYATWPSTTAGDVTLSWNHRNRVDQGVGSSLVAQDFMGGYTPEGNLTIEVLIGGTVKRTFAGITATSLVYTWAMRQTDDADLGKAVQFRITPINGSYQGTVRTTPAFVMG